MLQELEITSQATEETFLIGQSLSAFVFPSLVIFLSGELGAGKTVLARGLVQGLGGKHVRSPSFTLVNEYPTTPPVAHVDLYRLAGSETDTLGLDEYVENGYILIVEWADRLFDNPGDEVLNIHISYGNTADSGSLENPDDLNRQITISAAGAKTTKVLKQLKDRCNEKMEGGSR